MERVRKGESWVGFGVARGSFPSFAGSSPHPSPAAASSPETLDVKKQK